MHPTGSKSKAKSKAKAEEYLASFQNFTPWRLCPDGSVYDVWGILEGDENDPTVIASVNGTDNARLIVKAQEMWSALKLAQTALNAIPRTPVGHTDSYAIAALIDEVVAEVEGENNVAQ